VLISRITASISLKADGGGDEMHTKHLIVVIQTDNASELIGHVRRNSIPQTGGSQAIRPGTVVIDENGHPMPNATHGGEPLLNSYLDVARPTGQKLVIAYTPSPEVKDNIGLITLDGGANLQDVERGDVRIWQKPDIVLAATEIVSNTSVVTYPTTVEQAKRASDSAQWMFARGQTQRCPGCHRDAVSNTSAVTCPTTAEQAKRASDSAQWMFARGQTQRCPGCHRDTAAVSNTSAVTCPTTVEQAKRAPDSAQWMFAINKEGKPNVVLAATETVSNTSAVTCPTTVEQAKRASDSVQWTAATNEEVTSLAGTSLAEKGTCEPTNEMDLKVYHLDVVTAFLNPTLEDDVYARLPAGLGTPSRCAKLKKSAYGLKQAGHDWYKLHDKATMSIPGIYKSDVEPCWYYIKQGGLIVHILVHVDDFIIATNSVAWKHWSVKFFPEHFEVSDLGILDQVVRIGVQWGEKQVALTRTREILVTGEMYGLGDANSVLYPISCGFDLKKVKAGTGEKGLPYLNLMGELRYHERACRPDLSLALNKLGPFCADPSKKHYEALLKVARYAKGTSDLPFIITSRKLANNRYRTSLLTDATWSDCKETSRPTSGWAVYVNGNLVMSASKRQSCVTQSSTEAEICALSDGCKDLAHVHKTLKDLVEVELPVKVMVDNQATIAIMQNPVNNNRTRHIQTRLMWVGELVTGVLPDMEVMITLGYVRTDENVVDYFTKPLQGEKFEHFKNQMMGHG